VKELRYIGGAGFLLRKMQGLSAFHDRFSEDPACHHGGRLLPLPVDPHLPDGSVLSGDRFVVAGLDSLEHGNLLVTVGQLMFQEPYISANYKKEAPN
jgi:hypothetical protein